MREEPGWYGMVGEGDGGGQMGKVREISEGMSVLWFEEEGLSELLVITWLLCSQN